MKVGDRVKTEWYGKGTIVYMDNERDALVKHDKDINTYSFNVYAQYESDKADLWYYYNISRNSIKLEESVSKKSKYAYLID